VVVLAAICNVSPALLLVCSLSCLSLHTVVHPFCVNKLQYLLGTFYALRLFTNSPARHSEARCRDSNCQITVTVTKCCVCFLFLNLNVSPHIMQKFSGRPSRLYAAERV